MNHSSRLITKGLIIAALLLGSSRQMYAQQQDTGNTVLLRLPSDPAIVARFKQRLVELALQNPGIQHYDVQQEVNKYEKRIAAARWANLFSASGNLNEITLRGNSQGSVYYPRYNFGVFVPLGSFITIPSEVRRVKAQSKLIDTEKKSKAMELKARVLHQYEDYAALKQLLEIHLPVLEDALNHFSQIEEKFKAGDASVPMDIYKEAYRSYNNELVRKITLERDLRQSKIDLEGLVGVTLEEVLLQVQ
ncbi:TolC family protein [Chitinophaga solisilvae]|uniref:TolC family protein n=1 Tax=Chitinophaga solisilvae TaxID=1233460 RepID=A0A433WD40_9BACT|nr:TolC family protein [Chitinophaga solisilvae]NSL86699.1 TolC family protein [Chitinophaga solisilvae]